MKEISGQKLFDKVVLNSGPCFEYKGSAILPDVINRNLGNGNINKFLITL